MHSVQVTVQRILTSVLFAALRADDVGVLAAEVHVLDVTFEGHLVEVFVAIGAALSRVPVLFRRGGGGAGGDHGHAGGEGRGGIVGVVAGHRIVQTVWRLYHLVVKLLLLLLLLLLMVVVPCWGYGCWGASGVVVGRLAAH